MTRLLSRGRSAGSLDGDFDATVRPPALLRVIRGFRMGLAEALGRNDIRVDALRHEKGHYRSGAPGRQHQVVGDTLSLQGWRDRRVVRASVNDHFRTLETRQLSSDIVGEFRLAGLAELETALREQQSPASTNFCTSWDCASCALDCWFSACS